MCCETLVVVRRLVGLLDLERVVLVERRESRLSIPTRTVPTVHGTHESRHIHTPRKARRTRFCVVLLLPEHTRRPRSVPALPVIKLQRKIVNPESADPTGPHSSVTNRKM